MRNLYSLTNGQTTIMAMARAKRETIGNLPPLRGIFPDHWAPIVRNQGDGVAALALTRWGMTASALRAGALSSCFGPGRRVASAGYVACRKQQIRMIEGRRSTQEATSSAAWEFRSEVVTE